VGLFDLLVAPLACAIPNTRRLAWMVPVAGMVLSILVVIVTVLTFQPPPPDIGG
jgi:hypothetical protein